MYKKTIIYAVEIRRSSVYKVPLLTGLLNYNEEKNSLFCMPGNKGGKGFLRDSIGERFYKSLSNLDITEVEPLDNLHNPEGIIKESQELLSKLYNSYKSYFLVNGSTSGNLAAIFTLLNEGDKVIVERNCHRSILNGIILRKVSPVYIKNKYHEKLATPLSLDKEDFLCKIDENTDAKAIILTYPNYYGICCNLNEIIEKAHDRGMKVIVDSAHGAHFGINNQLPESAVESGADIVINSAHKTLPALTQGSYLHINKNIDIEKLEFYISAFTTTSPSYLIMASLDYSRYYLERYGSEDYQDLLIKSRKYRELINKIGFFHVLMQEDLCDETLDESRFIITLPQGYSGHKLLKYLRSNKIQCEMSDESSVVLILSIFNETDEFEKLYKVLISCDVNELKDSFHKINFNSIGKMIIPPHEALAKDKKSVQYDKALDKICGRAIVPYPPGVPIVMPGEKIDTEIINNIRQCIENNVTILGVEKEMIEVINH